MAFLYADLPGDKDPWATGFFIGLDLDVGGQLAMYLVTARHAVTDARDNGIALSVRLNRRSGGYADLAIADGSWVLHPTTDVAVCPIGIGADFDYLCLGVDEDVLTDVKIEARNEPPGDPVGGYRYPVGLGDNIFFVGLFSPHPGYEQARPVFRFGNISLMPEEPVYVELDGKGRQGYVDAYLIEARSRGGHSGAPAFLFYPMHAGPTFVASPRPKPQLLGLVQGHFEAPTKDLAIPGDYGPRPDNAGMAVVIPAQHIVDLLMSESLPEQRAQIAEAVRRHLSAARPDAPPTGGDSPMP